MTKGKVLFTLSSCARNGFVVSREETESNMSWITNWRTCPTDDESFYDATDSTGKYSNSILDCRWQLFGLEIGKYHGYDHGEYESFSYWRISHSSIVLPLILISFWLLLTKPRKTTHQEFTASIHETVM